jgi:DNA-binding MarR family transcriptional regulator
MSNLTPGASMRRQLVTRVGQSRSLRPVHTDALAGDYRPFGTPWTAMASTALAARCAGWNIEQWHVSGQALARELCAEHRKTRGRETYYLNRAWHRAAEYAADHPHRSDHLAIRRRLVGLERAADASPFGGRTGNADRLALAAVHALADERRSTSGLALAIRDVAARSGLTVRTAARALHRLVQRGWLENRTITGDPTHAATYDLTAPAGVEIDLADEETDEPRHPDALGLLDLATHDAFHPMALGRTAARVMAVLPVLEGHTAAETAQRLGLHPTTVRRALERLEATGAAWRVRRGRCWTWTARPDALDLDAIADASGTTGRLAARAEQIRRERDNWLDVVQFMAEARVRRHRVRAA